MSRAPMIPAQPADGNNPAQKFHAFAKKILAVPKAEIDAQEKRDATKAKKPKKT